MREAIGRRMQQSKGEAPHFYVQTEIDVEGVRAALHELNASAPPVRITMSVAFIRASVAALAENPRVNCVWTDEGLLQVADINLGVAISLDDGLIAPALLSAHRLGILETAVALQDLTQRARGARLRPSELSDSTFTLSNLGMYDVTAFTAIITPPQIAILAVGRAVDRVILRGGEIARASSVNVTLSADHRALDGVDAAKFLEAFKNALLDPDLLTPEPTN